MNKKSAFSILVLGFLFLAAASPLSAQITAMTPNDPQWGQTVAVTYDPAAQGAKFLPGDDVFVQYAFMPGDAVKDGSVRMVRAGGKFKAEIRIPEGTGFITLYFLTMNGWDDGADLGAKIFRPDGKPARDAWHGQMMHDFAVETYLNAFGEERRLYPDNLTVFRDKWFVESAFKKDTVKDTVAKELREIDKPGAAETVERLYAVSYGRLLLGEEPAGRAALRRMFELFPDHRLTAAALGSYEYLVFAQQIKGAGPDEVKNLKTALFLKNPASPMLRESFSSFAYDEKIPLDPVRVGCRAWMADEPENPSPRLTLAMALLRKGGDLKEADALMAEGLTGLVSGKLRFHGDIGGSLTRLWLPEYYAMAARIHENLGRYAEALAEVKAAQTVDKEIRAEAFDREASIWRTVGATRKAEQAYVEARRRGSKTAEGELKSIYRARHGSEDGFDVWLAEETKAPSAAGSGAKKPAPLFETKDIDGAVVRLSDFKGKVVVLNFWYIGCAPCRVEMPGLNTLVDEFRGQDVVFLGFALDKAPELKKFLEKNPFRYRIIPDAAEIAKQFGASPYPVHILINKKGEIEFFSTGGSEKRHEDLRPLIKTLLGS